MFGVYIFFDSDVSLLYRCCFRIEMRPGHPHPCISIKEKHQNVLFFIIDIYYVLKFMFRTILTVFVARKKKRFYFNIRCIHISDEEGMTLVFGPFIIIIPWNAPDIFSRKDQTQPIRCVAFSNIFYPQWIPFALTTNPCIRRWNAIALQSQLGTQHTYQLWQNGL